MRILNHADTIQVAGGRALSENLQNVFNAGLSTSLVGTYITMTVSGGLGVGLGHIARIDTKICGLIGAIIGFALSMTCLNMEAK